MSTEEQAAILGKLVLERRELHAQNQALREGATQLAKLMASLAPLSSHSFGSVELREAVKSIERIEQAGGVDRLKADVGQLLSNFDRLTQIENTLK